ncbi:MAG: metal-dependent hydrolase [Desulfohalobiaceae bacterium]|nr:metal-dependent hydrolase [Desulfohalobiaceae bacterium]
MSKNSLTWHGHANFQITTPSLDLIIDPWFEGNPSAVSSFKDCSKMDLVLVTHDHDDHIGQAVDIARATGAGVMAIVGTAQKLQEAGLPGEQIVNGIGFNIGGTVDFKGVKVTMVQAFHSSATGAPVGYIISLEDGFCVYHAGDTGVFSSMELFGRLYSIDLALLPIGDVFTMGPKQAALACELLKCRSVVPMHWGSFPVLEQGADNFAEELTTRGVKTRLYPMEPGQSIELGK